MLKKHEECKQKSWLTRRGKATKFRNFKPFYVGTVVDSMCRRYLETGGDYDMVSSVPEMMEQTALNSRAKGNGVLNIQSVERAELEDKALRCVTLLKPLLDEHVMPHEYQAERRFQVPVIVPSNFDGVENRNVILRGGVDIVVRYNDGMFSAFDLKSSPNKSYVRSIIGQGIFYDLVQACEFGQPYKQFAFMSPLIEEEPLVALNITNGDRQAMLARIVCMADDIATNQVEPKEGTSGCSWCEVKHACAKFDPTRLNRRPE